MEACSAMSGQSVLRLVACGSSTAVSGSQRNGLQQSEAAGCCYGANVDAVGCWRGVPGKGLYAARLPVAVQSRREGAMHVSSMALLIVVQ